MRINLSTDFTERLDDLLDRHAKGPQLALEVTIGAGIAHTGEGDFDQVRTFHTSQASLGTAISCEWTGNLHSRQLVFALSKSINAHRAGRQRPYQAGNVAKTNLQRSLAEEGLDALKSSVGLAEDIDRLLEEAPRDWPFRSACESILRGAKYLHVALGNPAAPAGEMHNHEEHGHGGGAIVVDVDEAIHGLYAAISYLVQAMKGGGQDVAKQFGEEAHVLATSPLDWVKDQGAPHGVADFAMGVSVGGVLLPFSLLAMKAGVEEIHAARFEHKRLGKLKKQLLERLDRLKPTPQVIEGPEGIQRLQVEQQLEALSFSKQQNTDGAMVGVFSLSSGAAIAAKVGLETGAKSAFIATSGAAGPAAATAAAGIAGTFALGPLAAGSAMGLGAYMVHKSAVKAKAFRAERRGTLAAHQDLREEQRSMPLKHYGDFLERKFDQHQRFYDNYRDWNKGFLAGSGIYTAGTLTKIGVVAAVGAGAVSLAHPATLGTVIALGVVGGAIMGASSHQFLSGHGRHHRYEGYFKRDDLELDRHFLASADLLCLNDPLSGPLAGLELRSDFYQHIYHREEQRQDLLERIANETSKRFTGRYTYTADTDATREKRGDKPGKRQRIKAQLIQRKEDAAARLSSATTFGSQLVSGRFSGAAQASRDTWNAQRTALSKTHITQWLGQNEPDEPAQTMRAMLDPQLGIVQKRLGIKLRTYGAIKVLGQGDVSLENGRMLRDVLAELDKDLEQDDLLYRQLTEMRDSLDQLGDENDRSERIGRFISLQMGTPYDASPVPLTQSHVDLAHYLLEDAPTRYRDLRGMLLETELEATRLRERFHESSTAAQC